MTEKRKSVHLASGLALGAIVAAGATFLYKTKKGKKFRQEFSKHLDDTKTYLPELIKDIKLKAKKLESSLEESNLETVKKTKKVKRQVNKALNQVKKKVFLKSGQPLVK
jgi:gas vesicle protein